MHYFNMFFIFSIIGFLFETIFVKGNFNSGILFGPYTPVYGIGAIIISLIYKFLDQHVLNKVAKVVLLIFLCILILTGLEWLGGTLIEIIFHKIYWSYENMRYNFGNYISLEISLIWGLASVVLIYLIKPLFDKVINRIPKWLTFVMSGIFLIDLVVTLIIK